MKRLDREHNNIRAALGWSLEHAADAGLRLAGALERFWNTQAHNQEGLDWLERVLSARQDSSMGDMDRWRAKALCAKCSGTLSPLSAGTSIAAGEEGVALWRKVGDRSGLACALRLLALARTFRSEDPAAIRALLEESASLQRSIGDQWGLVETVFWLGFMACIRHEHETAIQITEDCIRRAREAGDVIRVAGGQGLLGLIAAEKGDYATAQSYAEQSLRLYRQTEDNVGLYYQLSSLGALAILQGDYDRVQHYYTAAFEKYPDRNFFRRVMSSLSSGFVSLHQKRWKRARTAFVDGVAYLKKSDTPWANQCVAACLAGLAGIGLEQGHAEPAAKILGAVELHIAGPDACLAWGAHLGVTPTLIRKEYDRIVAEAARHEAAPAAIAEGRSLSLEQAVAIGLAPSEDSGTA
jgi:tetratricopeptide (TPR) repeat protein